MTPHQNRRILLQLPAIVQLSSNGGESSGTETGGASGGGTGGGDK